MGQTSPTSPRLNPRLSLQPLAVATPWLGRRHGMAQPSVVPAPLLLPGLLSHPPDSIQFPHSKQPRITRRRRSSPTLPSTCHRRPRTILWSACVFLAYVDAWWGRGRSDARGWPQLKARRDGLCFGFGFASVRRTGQRTRTDRSEFEPRLGSINRDRGSKPTVANPVTMLLIFQQPNGQVAQSYYLFVE